MNIEKKIEKAEEYERYFISKIKLLEISMNYQKNYKIDLKKIIIAIESLNLKERKIFDKEIECISDEQLHKEIEKYLNSISNEIQKVLYEEIAVLKVFFKDYEQEIKSTFY